MLEPASSDDIQFRRIARTDPVKVVAVTSGKGGVGKTNTCVNLAIALAKRGKRVMILDADLGLANVDVLLGLQPPFSPRVSDWLQWRLPFGAMSAANWIGMNANQYLHRYGATRELFGHVALNGRANAARGPL